MIRNIYDEKIKINNREDKHVISELLMNSLNAEVIDNNDDTFLVKLKDDMSKDSMINKVTECISPWINSELDTKYLVDVLYIKNNNYVVRL